MNEVRNLKSDAEVANMRKAGQASGRAYTDAMRQAWTKEKDLAAYLDYQFRARGCDCSAYVPVVAGGQVSFILSCSMAVSLTAPERQHHSLYPEQSSPKVSLKAPNCLSSTLTLSSGGQMVLVDAGGVSFSTFINEQ